MFKTKKYAINGDMLINDKTKEVDFSVLTQNHSLRLFRSVEEYISIVLITVLCLFQCVFVKNLSENVV